MCQSYPNGHIFIFIFNFNISTKIEKVTNKIFLKQIQNDHTTVSTNSHNFDSTATIFSTF